MKHIILCIQRKNTQKVYYFFDEIQEIEHWEAFVDRLLREENCQAVIETAHWLLNNIASSYTINSLAGYLKALLLKVTKETVAEYLDWLEDAYFLFVVKIFDASLSRTNVNPKKIYCVDQALVTSVASGILVNSGH